MLTNAKSPRIDKKQIAPFHVAQICRFLNFAPYKCLRIRSLPEKIQKIAALDVIQICRFLSFAPYKCLRILSLPGLIKQKSLLAMSLRSVGFELGPVQMPTNSKSPGIDETHR